MVQSANMPLRQAGNTANAVNINIVNPQAFADSGAVQTANPPYTYQNPIYDVPTASAYQQQVPAQAYQQYIPASVSMQQPVFVAPQPTAMPESVITPAIVAPVVEQVPLTTEAPVVEVAPVAPIATPVVEAQAPATPVQPVEIVAPQQAAEVVDIDALVNELKSTDPNVKGEAINKIAVYAQHDAPEVALQVVSEPIMQSLVDVIKEDTTNLQGPTAEQIAVAEKINKGEELTPEENAISEQLSPRDLANKNRIFAMYTLAMIQKLQREELNQYIEMQKANGQEAIAPLNVQDLVGFNEVANVIQNDSRPEVQVAAIQALDHIVEPQDKTAVEGILAKAQASADEAVKNAANELMIKFQA